MKLQIHDKENNPSSQAYLDKNKKRISQQCLKVLELLMQGKRLTTMNAPSYGILSLPRRIADLREKNGIFVDERWITPPNSSVQIKEWFISEITSGEKKELQKWLNDFQEEKPTLPPTPLQLF
jgi:hypothetical protein